MADDNNIDNNIASAIKSLSDQIKKLEVVITEIPSTYPDAGFTAYSRGDLVKGGFLNYYNVDNTILVAEPTDPNDFDSQVYNRERVYESLQRKSPFLQVINHGTDSLFVIVSHGGTTSFTSESRIRPGETKEYLNVYELRLRSPTLGLSYTITEYFTQEVCCPITPEVQNVRVINTPLPVTDSNIDITLTDNAKLVRWGKLVDPTWIHAIELVAPVASTVLVSKTVTIGKQGFLYGFFIESTEGNDFLINWTSSTILRQIRISFSSKGAVQSVDQVAINEGLSADAGTTITITNYIAGAVGSIYQCRLLYAEL